MEKSFIGQEDQMSKLRTEVGANLNSLNYDISGLLQFKNESGKHIIPDKIYSSPTSVTNLSPTSTQPREPFKIVPRWDQSRFFLF